MKKLSLICLIVLFVSCNSNNDAPTSATPENKEATEKQKPPANQTAAQLNSSVDFKILSISEGIYDNTAALQINTNLPIDKSQDLSQQIEVSLNGNTIKADWIFSANEMALYFPFIEADSNYEVRIKPSLLSADEQALGLPFEKKITTQEKKKSARFISRGNTLLKTDHALPIEAVNVDAVELKFWKVKNDALHDFLSQPNKQDIYDLQRLGEVAELVYTAHYAIDTVKNKTAEHSIPIKDIQAIKQAGVYFVTMMADDQYDYRYATTWFMQSDIGLHTRVYGKHVAVFSHKLPQADNYEGVKLSLYDSKGKMTSAGITNQQGYAELEIVSRAKIAYLIAEQEGNFNLVRFTQPQFDLSDYTLASRYYQAQELFLYGPRNLYRPGENVTINGLLRNADGELIKATPIQVQIKRPDNRLFKEINWQGDEQSFYSSRFTVPNDAMTGTWTFNAKLGNDSQFSYAFAVEDFLPERLKLDLQSGNQSELVEAGEKPLIKIQSDYLYGAPAAGNRYDATVTVNKANRLFEQYKDYVFGSNHYTLFDTSFTVAAGQLNDQGYAELEINKDWEKASFPLTISSHVNVYESGGRPISRKIKHTLWPQSIAIGVKPLWEDRFASPGGNNAVSLIAVDQSGESIDVPHAEVMLIQENQERYWHWGDSGWDYRNNSQETLIYNAVIALKKGSTNALDLPLNYGSYRIDIRNRQQQIISSYRFFSGYRWYDPYAYRAEKPDQVKLAWKGDAFKAGENAQLDITAPYAGSMLVTVESDRLLWQKHVRTQSAQVSVDIPISEDWNRHDIHASVMVIKPGDDVTESGPEYLPKRSFGVIHLPLNREDRKLDLTIVHVEKTLPDQPLKITIEANNINNGENTFVTLAAVDTGVLNVSNFITPDPFEWFFAQRAYLPELRDIYGALIEMIAAKQLRQKFGGDADLTRGGDEAQSEVQIVSLMTEKLAFNEQGKAEVELDLPYFNGELRLMAMAFNTSQFAGKESLVTVAAPVVVETSLPRFLAYKDASNATIEVHNTQDFASELNVQILLDDHLGGQKRELSYTLSANEKKIISVPIKGRSQTGLGNIRVLVESTETDFTLDRNWSLGLRPALPAVTDKYVEVLTLDQTYNSHQRAFDKFASEGLKAVLNVSDKPNFNSAQQLLNLLQYPYGCLEQTSSRAWPLLLVEASDYALFDTNQQQDMFSQRNLLVNQAISRLLGMQLYSGGFGLWSNDSPEEYWLTVYVTDFLIQAKNKGYSVPEQSLNNAITRLQSYARNASQLDSNLAQYLSHKNHFQIAYKAYAAYVLSGIQQISLQEIRRLYDQFNDQAKSPLPLAHLAMALELMGDEVRAKEAWLKAIDFNWQRERHAYYGDYGSKIRDYAEVIALGSGSQLMQQSPQSTVHLIKPLTQAIAEQNYLSTQERSVLFKSDKALMAASSGSGDWQAILLKGRQNQPYSQSEGLTMLWQNTEAKEEFSFQNTSEKPLYIDVSYQGYLNKHVAESKGVAIKKRYFDINGNNVDLSHVASGDNLLVHLELSLDKKYNYLPDAMIIDLLPAGFELENQNLEHALKLDTIKVDGKNIEEWGRNSRIKHSEYRDDRFVAALTLSSYNNAHVFYLVRAVTPGEYVIPPALVEDMYRPEIRSTSDDLGKVIIKAP